MGERRPDQHLGRCVEDAGNRQFAEELKFKVEEEEGQEHKEEVVKLVLGPQPLSEGVVEVVVVVVLVASEVLSPTTGKITITKQIRRNSVAMSTMTRTRTRMAASPVAAGNLWRLASFAAVRTSWTLRKRLGFDTLFSLP